MSKNTFNTEELNALRAFNKEHESVLIKRSRFYTKAVVVGVPDKPGSLLISYVDHGAYWLTHSTPDLSPKELADGIGVDLHEMDEDRFYRWRDLAEHISKWSSFQNHN